MADTSTKEEEVPAAYGGGALMQCGATDYWAVGRTKDVRPEFPNLPVPHRLKALEVRWRGGRLISDPHASKLCQCPCLLRP
jgi:hypothetical protein